MTSTEPTRPRVIILADGKTKDVHLDSHRLLTPIEGVPLIQRTVRQFARFAHVAVMAQDEKIIETVRGQRFMFFTHAEDRSDQYGMIDMIRKGLEVAYSPRNIIVFGDVVWTDEAVATVECSQIDTFAFYGRSGASEVLGTPYAEYFAFEVDWKGRAMMKGAVDAVNGFYRTAQWHRQTAWEVYRHMEKMPYDIPDPADIEVGPHWVEIDDGTDDIDVQEDIDRIQEFYASKNR